MIRILLLTVFSLVTMAIRSATLRFYYIAHNEKTPVPELISAIDKFYNNAVELEKMEDINIIYLANHESPIICIVGGKNATDQDNYLKIKGELQVKLLHPVNVDYDLKHIIKLMSEDYNIYRKDGSFRFDDMQWTFYVNSEFWLIKNGQSLVSSLYWIFDVHKLGNQNFSMDILCSEDDEIKVKDDKFFGEINPDGINRYKILPM